MQTISSDFLAIDRKSRAYMPFLDIDIRDPQERVCDFDDVVIPLEPERARDVDRGVDEVMSAGYKDVRSFGFREYRAKGYPLVKPPLETNGKK